MWRLRAPARKSHGGKDARVQTRNNKNAMGYPCTPTHTNGTHKRFRGLRSRSWRTDEVFALSWRRAFPLGKIREGIQRAVEKANTGRSFLPPKTHLLSPANGRIQANPRPYTQFFFLGLPAFSMKYLWVYFPPRLVQTSVVFCVADNPYALSLSIDT